jgi:predicted DNA-binding transcriptional regulator YafY
MEGDMKIDRLIAIVMYLQCREKVTARELASYFNVTLRTIYRDMDALSLAGVPVASFQGTEGGYGLVESFRLDRTFFKEEELLSLFTAMKGINEAVKDKAMETALLKLRALGPKTGASRENMDALPRVIYIPIPWGIPQAWSRQLDVIRDAIEHRRPLGFTYTKIDGAAARRHVEPLTLVLQAAVWYLYAWDMDKNDYRFFRLSRFSGLEVKEGSLFKRKPGKRPFPWEAMWETGSPMELRLRFSPAAAQKARDAFPWESPEVRADGSLVFTMRVPYGDWVDNQILSFGPDVEVLFPDWVKARIRDRALETAAQYGTMT